MLTDPILQEAIELLKKCRDFTCVADDDRLAKDIVKFLRQVNFDTQLTAKKTDTSYNYLNLRQDLANVIEERDTEKRTRVRLEAKLLDIESILRR
jgi:hypothetical protein